MQFSQDVFVEQVDRAFDHLLYERLDATLGEYVGALQAALPTQGPVPRPTSKGG